MPFEIVRNNIVNMQVDAIVNTTNPTPVIGYGVDAGIHQKAGPALLEARKKVGWIPVGDAAVTPGFELPASYVIHAVCPVWQGGGHGEEKLLKSCYERSLKLAYRQHCSSVAIPLLSAGNHGFPKPVALQIALDAIGAFLLRHEIMVYLVVFSRDAFQLSEKLFRNVASFIDETCVEETNLRQYGVSDKCQLRGAIQRRILQAQEPVELRADACSTMEALSFQPEMPAPSARPKAQTAASVQKRKGKTLTELLMETDAGFSETLLRLIDNTGKKDSEIYTRANVSRQHFSKIRNNPDYKPTKATAIAFAIALELNMEQTQDLIGRAGYALTKSSKFDVIIMYFIMEKNYNLFDINAALFEFDQNLLGA